MDPFQGIIVQVISNGKPLDFYDDPDAADIDDDHVQQHYIEATTGSKFSIKVILTERFNFHNLNAEDAVGVTIQLDGHADPLKCSTTRKQIEDKFLKGEPKEMLFNGEKHYCAGMAKWTQNDYSFGKLETSSYCLAKVVNISDGTLEENADMGLSVDQAKQLGRIQIQIRRYRREKRHVPMPPSIVTTPTIGEVSEKALKGRAIANAVTFINTRPCEAPAPSNYQKMYIPGPAGKMVVYNLLYRSRHALQMIGCIPRSPSPTIEVLDDGVAGSQATEREVKELRARLARLERGLPVKAEPGTGVKREREEDNQQTGSRRRPRGPVNIETIDLTTD